MKNAVGRDIPEALLVNGKEVYQGKNYMDGKYLQKAAPCTRRYERPQESKIVETLADALRQCGAKDGMTFSFHHHLRNGDYVVNMVMKAAIEELGLKDLTIAATSLGEAHDPIAEYIEEGKVVGVDVDQSGESPTVITSAMKGLADSAQWALGKFYAGEFASIGGVQTSLGANENAVGLPTATWSLTKWSVDSYKVMLQDIKDGKIAIDNNYDNLASTENLTLNIVG